MEKSKRKNDGVPLQVFTKSENEQGIYAMLLLFFGGFSVWLTITILRLWSDEWWALLLFVPFSALMIYNITSGMKQELRVYEEAFLTRWVSTIFSQHGVTYAILTG